MITLRSQKQLLNSKQSEIKNVLFVLCAKHMGQPYATSCAVKSLQLLGNKNFFFITFCQEKTIKKIIDISIFKDILYLKFDSDDFSKSFDQLQKFVQENSIDTVIIHSHFFDIAQNTVAGMQQKVFNNYIKAKNNNFSMTSFFVTAWDARFHSFLPLFLIDKFDINVIHIYFDPLQINYLKFTQKSKQLMFNDRKKDQGIIYSPIEFYCSVFTLYEKYKEQTKHKKYNFVFAYTAKINSKSRVNCFYFLNNTNFHDLNIKINIRSRGKQMKQLLQKESKFDGRIQMEDYNKNVANSMFTYIVPSYDETQISLIRVYEALILSCIPIFDHQNVITRQNFSPLNDIYEIIVKYNLIMKQNENLYQKITELSYEYDKIISAFNNSETIKNLKNKNYYLESVSKTLEIS